MTHSGTISSMTHTAATAAIIARVRAEILSDIATGVVPPSVTTFGELHSYVDANEYGGMCAENADVTNERWATIQTAVDAWLQAGRPTLTAPAAVVTIMAMCSKSCPGSYLERTGGRHMPGCDQAASPEDHRQVWILNPYPARNAHGGRLRFLVGCSCGQHATMAPAKRGVGEVRWHDGHRRTLDLDPQMSGTPVYGPGAAAEGMTWDEWRAAGNTTDPWTGEA